MYFVCIRRALDAAHLAGVPANLFPSAPTTTYPGSAERVQLYWRGGVHRGTHNTRPPTHVPDPSSQQGLNALLQPEPVSALYLPILPDHNRRH